MIYAGGVLYDLEGVIHQQGAGRPCKCFIRANKDRWDCLHGETLIQDVPQAEAVQGQVAIMRYAKRVSA